MREREDADELRLSKRRRCGDVAKQNHCGHGRAGDVNRTSPAGHGEKRKAAIGAEPSKGRPTGKNRSSKPTATDSLLTVSCEFVMSVSNNSLGYDKDVTLTPSPTSTPGPSLAAPWLAKRMRKKGKPELWTPRSTLRSMLKQFCCLRFMVQFRNSCTII